MDAISLQLEVAEGFAHLRMHLDAWEALEFIPARHQTRTDVLTTTLVVSQVTGRWHIGMDLVKHIRRDSPAGERERAGRFHLARAHFLCGRGDLGKAREAVHELAAVWPEGRPLVLASQSLAAVW